MKDEARNTGHRSSLWGGDTRLRAKPIGFVSAGLIEPLKEELQDVRDDQSSKRVGEAEIAMEEDAIHQAFSISATEDEDLTLTTLEPPLDLTKPSTPTDRTTATITTGTDAVDVLQPEGIGFIIDVTGDKSMAANLTNSPPPIPDPQSPAEESDSSSEVILFKGRANRNQGKEPAEQKRMKQTITLDTIRYEIKAVEAEIALDTNRHSNAMPPSARSHRQNKRGKFKQIDDDEEAIIADYIANMAEDSDDGSGRPSRQPVISGDLGADDGNLGIDTSEGSVSSDDSAGFDDGQERETAIDSDLVDRQGSEDDDMASPTMDDETFARLLGKQEELGMGGDELLLTNSQKSRRAKGVNTRTQGPFSGTNAVADAFDDLDLMDWERPSLQNKRKGGRRGQPPVFGVSDSEIEQTLQTAWQKDRESKKSRKLRREEQRAQGLLGKHSNPDDPRLRYPTGMSLEDIKTEMRSFLQGTEARLELPPMDKSARKTLHELARKFKVKSQSTGSGHQRRPTLIRTKYTTSYAEEHLEIAVSGLGRRHFPRLDLKGKDKAAQRKSRAGAGNSAVTYQEGEIVGASAPELGQENKGRAMLEKMGWSSGMGLGSLDNKGILQPVAHVVKRSKAGLG
ncbi:hypothetical protein CONLIGDRAFT_601474 [Coniochaeta ligniaria NRRL 30616]|uniref:Protein SQS1 n=1 Tax=Coniochaeta ligniaria NRRL 30616 TaxID=1408157 RepID=A0A1J7IH45_9PEZI|nr:hypothetical protein CONLIGDRAFT_601474 [Coniochaeta ligniaria NRRL 30616]